MSDIPLLALIAIIGSALAHSGMALFTKRAEDTLVFRGLSLSLSALWLSPLLFILPFPDWEVWRFLLIGAAIIWVFNLLMIAAFQRGAMNLVYPVMRGASPTLTGLAAWVILGEPLSVLAMIGLATASGAIILFAWPEKGGAPKAAALAFALSASVMTAAYSVNDASGVRAAGSALLYVTWFFALSAPLIVLTAFARRGRAVLTLARKEAKGAFISSFFNIATYGLALYAYANAPVAPMAAMRETSVVFGATLAALVLKEPFGLRRSVLAILLAAGLVLLQIG